MKKPRMLVGIGKIEEHKGHWEQPKLRDTAATWVPFKKPKDLIFVFDNFLSLKDAKRLSKWLLASVKYIESDKKK